MFEFIINYWVELFFSLLIFVITSLYRKMGKYCEITLATKKGVSVLLKTKIIEKYNFYKNKDSIPIYDKEIINELYKEYKILGGNGLIDSLINELNEKTIK